MGAQISLLPRQGAHAGMKGRYSAREGKHKDDEILGGERQKAVEEMEQVLNEVGDDPKGS